MSDPKPPTPPTPPPPEAPPPARRSLALAIGVVIAGLVVGSLAVVLILPKWLASPVSVEVQPTTATAADNRKIHAVLFYVADDGSQLVQVSQEVPFGATPVEQARKIIEAEVAAAPTGLTSAIPSGTTVRSVLLDARGAAYVDLSHEIVTGATGGSLDEALTVFSIVNAITANLPDITGVQILVDGKSVDTLTGHLDLRHPLSRSLGWVRKGQ
jgi:spore germination protein GerM